MKTIEHKADTRRKIQLGGLIKKAGLDHEPTSVILGLLLEAAEALQEYGAEQIKSQWRLKGDIALTRNQYKANGRS